MPQCDPSGTVRGPTAAMRPSKRQVLIRHETGMARVGRLTGLSWRARLSGTPKIAPRMTGARYHLCTVPGRGNAAWDPRVQIVALARSRHEHGCARAHPAAESACARAHPATESACARAHPATESGCARAHPATESACARAHPATESGRARAHPATESGCARAHPATESGRARAHPATTCECMNTSWVGPDPEHWSLRDVVCILCTPPPMSTPPHDGSGGDWGWTRGGDGQRGGGVLQDLPRIQILLALLPHPQALPSWLFRRFQVHAALPS